ncbi:MAG TPA: hypothetical protein VLM91_22885 [Candidatus Methylomirabilis sp.]|nr:hypothetical protein [Candidatus Methylomirabilis sp.]
MKWKIRSGRPGFVAVAGGLVLAVLLVSAGTAAAGRARVFFGVRSGSPFVHRAFVHPHFVPIVVKPFVVDRLKVVPPKVPSSGVEFATQAGHILHHPFLNTPFGFPVGGLLVGVDAMNPVPPTSLVIVQRARPVSLLEESPPPPPEPSYYWYACGPAGEVLSSREPARTYCLGGLSPSVTLLPSPGKTLDQFQVDDGVCRRWASAQTSTLPGTASTPSTTNSAVGGTLQVRYDLAYQQCMSAKGNQTPRTAVAAQSRYSSLPPPSPR